MAWTEPPRTWTTTELVTAAMMNTHVRDQLSFLLRTAVYNQQNNAGGVTFTNTGFLDLDALTGGSAGAACAVTFSSPSSGLVQVALACQMSNSNVGSRTFIGFRVSGATTIAANDNDGPAFESDPAGTIAQIGWVGYASVNAGSNTYEMQAHASSGTSSIARTSIGVALV